MCWLVMFEDWGGFCVCMSLFKNVGMIGGLMVVSCVFGFVCDMLFVWVLGVGLVVDVFQFVFMLFNIFCWFFVEGVFLVVFVLMYLCVFYGGDDLEVGEVVVQ